MSNPTRRAAPVPAASCGLAHAAELLGDRWTLLLLRALFYGLRRFDDLQAELGVSRPLLSNRLDRLISSNLVERRPYRAAGQRLRQEYVLAETSRDLAPALIALFEWGGARAGLSPSIRFEDRETGAELRLALVDGAGHVVAPDRLRTVLRATGEVI